jgi:hypothetical protein
MRRMESTMLWYGDGWYWWWLAFLVLFFVVPVAYGWGYRGWGPWYRRSVPQTGSSLDGAPGLEEPGWGWVAVLMWIVLGIGFVWAVLAMAAWWARPGLGAA